MNKQDMMTIEEHKQETILIEEESKQQGDVPQKCQYFCLERGIDMSVIGECITCRLLCCKESLMYHKDYLKHKTKRFDDKEDEKKNIQTKLRILQSIDNENRKMQKVM